jgi:excisionase family DNA binding protein
VQEILAYIERDRYMSLNEAVRYLALSERTLRERLRQIPHSRVGAKLLFRKSELDGWMQKHGEHSPCAPQIFDLTRKLAFEHVRFVRHAEPAPTCNVLMYFPPRIIRPGDGV